MTLLTALSFIIMFLFILPVFTGQVVNIGNVTGFACGFFFCMLCRDPAMIEENWVRIILAVLLVCFLIAFILSAKMFAVLKHRPEGRETLVVLGCEIMGEKPSLMQVERLQAALEYLNAYPQTKVICSGGKGKKEKISEAEAMKIWLVNHGVEPERIYEENRSETTLENIRFSKEIIERNGLEKTIAVCTNEFHLYRAVQIAESLSLKAVTVPAKTAWWLIPTFCVREFYAILYFLIRKREKS